MGIAIFIFKEDCDENFDYVGCTIRIQVLIITVIKYFDVLIFDEKILIYIVAKHATYFLEMELYF